MDVNKARTLSIVKAAQLFAGGKRPKRGRKVPRPGSTKMLEREYANAIAKLVSRDVVRAAFRDLLRELPGLLESARRERGDAAVLVGSVAMAIANIPDPVQRVHAWLAGRERANAMARIDADEGKRARELIAQAKDRLREAISTRKIEELAEEFGRRTSTFQRMQIAKQTKAVLGADIFTGDKGMRTRLSNFASENVSLIKGAVEEGISTRVEKMVTRALTTATPHAKLAEALEDEFGFGEKRSKLIARDQIGKLYGQIDAARQKDLGVTRFIWRASPDDRTREHHATWDGETFEYSDPPVDPDLGVPTLPGEAILCRCTAEPVLDDLLEEGEAE